MKSYSSNSRGLFVLGTLLAAAPAGALAIDFTGSPYSQNFDGLISTGNVSSVFSSTIGTQAAIPSLAGWSGAKAGGTGSAATNFVASDGASTSGGLYSFGPASGSTERALGVIASGSNAMAFGAEFTNTSGHTITSITISFTAEFWRSSTAQQNVLTFAYGFSGGAATAGNYLTHSSLTTDADGNVVGPVPVSSNGPLVGNNIENRKAVSFLLDGLNWEDGTTLYLRWTDMDNGGSDAGLSLDDFSLVEGEPLDPNDVSIGTLDDVFSASSFGGNAFTATNNAVFDGSAATVNLSGAVTANSLKFVTSGYTLAGTGADSLALSSGRIAVEEGGTAMVSGILTGTAGLSKEGDGTLLLSGSNTFSGTVTVSDGRLEITGDDALGAAANDLVLAGTLASSGSLSLSADRAISGTGSLETGSGAALAVAGALGVSDLAVTGPATVTFGGATNSAVALTFSQPVALNIGSGNLAITSSLVFAQSSGTSTVAGGLNFGAGATTLRIDGGVLTPSGTFAASHTGGNRLIKSGAGVLDMTATTFTTLSGAAGFRLGVQGGFPQDGGTLRVNDATDLGAAQLQFNSGLLEATTPLTFALGVSLGGRAASSVPAPTLAGSDITFTGDSSFFLAGGASGDLGLTVNNTATFTGAWTPTTVPSAATPVPTAQFININGSGTLAIAGDASAILDNFYLTGTAELAIEGTLGGLSIQVSSGTTLSGGGVFSGSHIFPATGVPELYTASTVVVQDDGTLAPSGSLALFANLQLENGSTTVLSIGSATVYDSVDVSVPVGSTLSYTLAYDGDLILNFDAPAIDGTYGLFTIGATGVARSGSFDSVTLGGAHVSSLSLAGTVWSGTVGGVTFSFDESTGVLAVTGGGSTATPLETWRQTHFGTAANTGTAADSADFDNDGIANLIEYAIGADPTEPTASAVMLAQSDGFLTLTFNRIDDPSLTYVIQESNDPAAGFTNTGTSYSGTANDTITYADTVPLATPGVKRFLRLQVTY